MISNTSITLLILVMLVSNFTKVLPNPPPLVHPSVCLSVISRGVQNGCVCNLLLFRQVRHLRSINLLILVMLVSNFTKVLPNPLPPLILNGLKVCRFQRNFGPYPLHFVYRREKSVKVKKRPLVTQLKWKMLKSFILQFWFQLCHQGVLFNFHLTFLIYEPFIKKAKFRFLIGHVLTDLASYIASTLKQHFFWE